jgi:mono/diheme cytochrome c family protein
LAGDTSVTEIPEHLLRRSKERRAALEGDATAEATGVTSATSGTAPVPAGPAAAAPATQAGGAGGLTPTTGRPVVDRQPDKPRVGPTRAGVPLWIMPVLIALPLWGIVYLGAFGSRAKANANDPVTLGAAVFAANCSTCHGASGEGGGTGPRLNGGEVLRVWPNLKDHIAWVHTGGAPFVGKTIGATHIPVPANNVMPAFAGTLSDDQIAQVVCYERVSFGGEAESATNCPGFTG